MISLNVPQNQGQPPAEALLSDTILLPTALCSEGDARRQASRAVARHLQPFQGWFTFCHATSGTTHPGGHHRFHCEADPNNDKRTMPFCDWLCVCRAELVGLQSIPNLPNYVSISGFSLSPVVRSSGRLSDLLVSQMGICGTEPGVAPCPNTPVAAVAMLSLETAQ